MTSLAAAYPGLAKLVVIGQSGQGQDIVALKVTQDARNVADGARPAMLFSAVNHAREWIAAEVGRRMPTWWLEHADDPQIAELLSRNELWFLPIQNPDGYDYTFTCGTGFRTAANEMCGATLVTDPASPLRGTYVYKTADGIIRAPNAAQPDPRCASRPTACGARRCATTTATASTATARTASTRTATTRRRGASTRRARATAFGSETYRGPYPLSEPEDLAYDRLLRRITPEAVINYHSAAQLLLYPFGYITDVYADDDPWFKAITGTDGDAAVDPYISQRSSDLYITNGETTDHAYNKYGIMAGRPSSTSARRPPAARSAAAAPASRSPTTRARSRRSSRRTSTSRATSRRRRSTATVPTARATRPTTRRSTRSRPRRTSSRTGSTSPTAPTQTLEATARRILGPVDFVVQVASPAPAATARTLTLRAEDWRGGERFGDLRGKYYQRVRAQIPADFVQPGTAQTPRPLVAGDEVNVRVIAGSQQQRFSYRVVSTRPAGDAKRVLVVAAEDYTGLSPNKTPYATAPRYLDEHVAALEANGYAVETYDIDDPPAGPDGSRRVQAAVGPRRAVALRRRRLLHGRRPGPAGARPGRDRHELPPRRHRGGERHVQPDRARST